MPYGPVPRTPILHLVNIHESLAGQSAGLIDEFKSVQAIIEGAVAQFLAINARLSGLAAAHAFG